MEGEGGEGGETGEKMDIDGGEVAPLAGVDMPMNYVDVSLKKQ